MYPNSYVFGQPQDPVINDGGGGGDTGGGGTTGGVTPEELQLVALVAAYGSNTGGWSSNALPFTSNAAVFGSNAGAWSSNAARFASNAAVFGSNAARFSSNLAVTTSNYAYTLKSSPWTQNGAGAYITGSNIGINVTTPGFPLDVRGTIKAWSNVLVGEGGQQVLITPSNVANNLGLMEYAGVSTVNIRSDMDGTNFGDAVNVFCADSNVARFTQDGLQVWGDIDYSGALLKNGVPVTLGGTSPWTQNGARAYITDSNIGIGTTTPVHPLEVRGTINTTSNLQVGQGYYRVHVTPSNVTNNGGLMEYSGHSDTVIKSDRTNSLFGANIYLACGATYVAEVNNKGVGIFKGASYPLDVEGDINFSGVLRQNGVPLDLGGGGGGDPVISTEQYNFTSNTAVYGSNAARFSSNLAVTTSNYAFALKPSPWKTDANKIYTVGSNVGIGTTTPFQTLEAVGNIKAWSNMWVGDGFQQLRISPSNIQNVSGTMEYASEANLLIRSDNNNTSLGGRVEVYCASTNVARFSPGGFKVFGDLDYTGTLMRNGVPVSLGGGSTTASPSPWKEFGANTYILDSNVGVNTESPLYPLDVNGGMRARGDIISEFGSGSMTLSPTSVRNTSGEMRVMSEFILKLQSDYNENNGGAYIEMMCGSVSPVIVTPAGLGVYTSPNYRLDVNGDINCSGAFRQNGVPLTIPANIWKPNGNRAYILGSNVGIGKNNPVQALDVVGNITASGRVFGATVEGGSINATFNVTAGGVITPTCSLQKRDEFTAPDAGVYFAYGTSGIDQALITSQQEGFVFWMTNSFESVMSPRAIIQRSGFYTQVSDSNLKNHVRYMDASRSLDIVNELKPTIFSYKGDSDHLPYSGFYAQDVMKVIPEAVSRLGDSVNLGMSYVSLIPHLTSAVQALSLKVDHLQAQLDALNGQGA